MPDTADNKENLFFFAAASMKKLFDAMDEWQKANRKRFLQLSIHQDGDDFACIALTNPTEVVISDKFGTATVEVTRNGSLRVWSPQ